jgi:hypothetical protein
MSIKEWKNFLEKHPHSFLKMMNTLKLSPPQPPPISSSRLRNTLPQEMWDKVSENFARRDWGRMNQVLAVQQGVDKNGKPVYDYPFSENTPAYKKRIKALKHVQNTFRKNRNRYHHVLQNNPKSDDISWTEYAEKIAQYVLNGDIPAVRATLDVYSRHFSDQDEDDVGFAPGDIFMRAFFMIIMGDVNPIINTRTQKGLKYLLSRMNNETLVDLLEDLQDQYKPLESPKPKFHTFILKMVNDERRNR